MVTIVKSGYASAAALWLAFGSAVAAAPAPVPRLEPLVHAVDAPAQPSPNAAFRMVVVRGKDLSGRVYKKLGLPSLQYCWDTCVREAQCTGARWGVIRGDVAGLCLLLSGDLSVKESVRPTTEDGKAIQVIAGRKQANARGAGGT